MTTPGAPRGSVRFGQRSAGRPAAPGFGAFGIAAGAIVVALVVGGLVWSAAHGSATSARHPRIFAGSLVLDDYRPLTVVDVADAEVTVRLQGVYAQVSAERYSDIEAVPVSEGTMLVNTRTGTFNLLGKDDYVVDATGAGIGLGPLAGTTGAQGFSDGADAYIVRYGPRSTVSLVDQATVTAGAQSQTSARTAASVTPRGFADLGGPVTDRPGASAVSGGDLWSLIGQGRGCRIVISTPVASGHDGLVDHQEGRTGTACAAAALESSGGVVGVATPGRVRLFGPGVTRRPGRGGATVAVPTTARASELLPVTGSTGELWYLARLPAGWSVFGVTARGRVTPAHQLPSVGPKAELATPVESAGRLYTLDRTAVGQPLLWVVSPATGAVTTVPGARRYPARSVDERASFEGAEMLVDGPRVVFNNPDSLLAVVVFTDGSHAPVTIDKSTAVDVSAVGPGDIDAKPIAPKKTGPHPPPTPKPPPAAAKPAPVAQPVNQQVTCANTTQTPYAPQISSIAPSSESALVSWSYQLLDEQDCEPDSWSVAVTALGGIPQPDQPVQVVNGQNQLVFTGLRPAATYKAVVTAYINHQSTPSAPATFTTTARGPDAPTSVTTTADGNGDWIVTWTPCTSSTCYVPADTWTVTGTSCGSAYVGQPPTVQVPGDQDSVTIPAGSLLGASLSFSVEGSTAAGLGGAPAADGTCTEAWQAPNPSDITLDATGTAAGSTVTATLGVTTTGSAVQAFGSSATELTYSVGGVTVGPTTQTTVTVPDLPAGVTYTPTVAVAPANHPTASVTITGAPFSQTVPWPTALAVHATAATDSNPNSGTVTASFSDLPPGTFNATGGITCGSVQLAMNGSLTDGQVALDNVDLDTMGGRCTLSLTLADTDTPDPYGAPSPPLSTPFTLGAEPSYGFAAAVDPSCTTYCSQADTAADVTFPAGGQPAAGVNWTVSTSGSCPGVPPVSSSTPSFPYQINLSSCADPQGATFAVSWEYLGATQTSPIEPLQGTFGTTTTSTTTTSTTTTSTTTTTSVPVTPVPTTPVPTTPVPTTPVPTTPVPTSPVPTSPVPTTPAPTTPSSTTTTCDTTTTSSSATSTTTKSGSGPTPSTSSSTTTTSTTTTCHASATPERGLASRGLASHRPSGAGILAAVTPSVSEPPADGAGRLVLDAAIALMALALCPAALRSLRRRSARRRRATTRWRATAPHPPPTASPPTEGNRA